MRQEAVRQSEAGPLRVCRPAGSTKPEATPASSGSSTPGNALVKLLEENSSSYTWVAATVGSNAAAGYQLATDDPVMAIGGFNGTDPAPTLSEFETYVDEGKIHWFIATSGPDSGGTGSDAAEISAWVESHYTAIPWTASPSTTSRPGDVCDLGPRCRVRAADETLDLEGARYELDADVHGLVKCDGRVSPGRDQGPEERARVGLGHG